MKYLTIPVIDLKNEDFDKLGHLINPIIPKDKPVIIMIYANYCGYCTIAKPDFQKFAINSVGKYICATIQGDGDDKKLHNKLKKIYPNFQYYPSYIVYNNGEYVKDYNESGRDVKSLTTFAESLSK